MSPWVNYYSDIVKSRKSLVNKADKLFSEYIRRRNANHAGLVSCFTCGKQDEWKRMDAGHFMSRKHYATRWDEENVQVQCKGCNIFRSGEQYMFGLQLDRKYGPGKAEELMQKSRGLIKLSNDDLEALGKLYATRLHKLDK